MAAHIFLEHVGIGADQMPAQIILVGFDHFPCGGNTRRHRHDVEEVVVSGIEFDFQCVFVNCLKTFNFRVVVKLAGLFGSL